MTEKCKSLALVSVRSWHCCIYFVKSGVIVIQSKTFFSNRLNTAPFRLNYVPKLTMLANVLVLCKNLRGLSQILWVFRLNDITESTFKLKHDCTFISTVLQKCPLNLLYNSGTWGFAEWAVSWRGWRSS